MRPLNILHVLRAPVGGLFRHVLDLARGQADLGHRVGIVADSTTGGDRAKAAFSAIGSHLQLGFSRVPMSRHIGLSDLGAIQHVSRRIAESGTDVVHGHGAKGGAYARIAAGPAALLRVYTPHGGSIHYSRTSPAGLAYQRLRKSYYRAEISIFLKVIMPPAVSAPPSVSRLWRGSFITVSAGMNLLRST